MSSQSVLRADLVFVLATPFNRHARRQRNFLREPRLRFLHEAAEVAALDIRLHEHAQTPVLAVDFARPNLAADFGHVAERNKFSCRRRHEQIAEPRNVVAFAALQADLDRNPLAPGNRGGNIFAADAGFDQIQNVLRAQAVARHRHAVHLDVEIRLALRARRGDADRAGNFPHDALDLERLLLQRVQIVAKNLDADLRADAGADHQNAVLNRLQKSGDVAGHLRQFFLQLGHEFVLGHARAPLRIPA